MNRSDYTRIARVFKKRIVLANTLSYQESRIAHYKELAVSLCEVLHEDNARFNEELFLKACGFNEES
jgi:hypothetical protein